MNKLLQTLMDGTAVGSLYALIALGYTMVYGILQFINFAHSDIFVLGAWVSLTVAAALGWGSQAIAPDQIAAVYSFTFAVVAWGLTGWVLSARFASLHAIRVRWLRLGAVGAVSLAAMGIGAVAGFHCGRLIASFMSTFSGPSALHQAVRVLFTLSTAMITCGSAGFFIERLAYKPLRKAPRLNVLITAIGVSLFLQNWGQLQFMFGAAPRPMPAIVANSELFTLGTGASAVKVSLVDVIGFASAVSLMIMLDVLVFRTRVGRAMRAVSFSPRSAALMGVPVDAVISFTFVLGTSLAAAAGVLQALKYSTVQQPAHTVWVLLGLKAFVAAVVGGIGNVRGAMLGGFLIGWLEMFGVAYLDGKLRDVYVFALLIIVLLVRPSGLLGTARVEKV